MKKVMAGIYENTLTCCMKKAGTWMFSSFESIRLLQEVKNSVKGMTYHRPFRMNVVTGSNNIEMQYGMIVKGMATGLNSGFLRAV